MNATFAGESEKARGDLVSGNYFETLGVQPLLGRLLTQADDEPPGAHPLAGLSYDYWQRRFGGDPAIAGGKLTLNNHLMTVAGITPPGFYGTDLAEVTDIRVPMMATVFRHVPANRLQNSGQHGWKCWRGSNRTSHATRRRPGPMCFIARSTKTKSNSSPRAWATTTNGSRARVTSGCFREARGCANCRISFRTRS